MLTHEDCLVEVFDEQGKVVKIKPRKEALPKTDILKAVYVFVCNSKGELWLTISPDSKLIWPNHYWPSASGIVRHRETPDQAVLRTAKRELGVKAPKLKLLGSDFINFNGMRQFAYCYCCEHDGRVEFDPRDVQRGDFLSQNEVEDLMKSNQKRFSPMFSQLYDKFKSSLFTSM